MAHQLLSNFDTIPAEDFLEDLSINGYGLISVVLDRIIQNEETASLTDCEEGLIACEIVAAVSGNPAPDFPPELLEWLEMFVPPGSDDRGRIQSLSEKAADVIDRIVAESELKELWLESPDYNPWLETQVDLQNRILTV